jgi:YVTN family beta-propeller protein
MHVSPSGISDNVFHTINPGQTQKYVLDVPKNHPMGTFWYHTHAHPYTEAQVFGGLAALLVIDGLTDLLPPELQGIKEQTVALKDYQSANGEILRQNIDSNARDADGPRHRQPNAFDRRRRDATVAVGQHRRRHLLRVATRRAPVPRDRHGRPNEFTSTLSVVNTVDRVVLVNIDLATGPDSGLYNIAISPNGAHVYVTDEAGDTVTVISAAASKVVKSIPLAHPIAVAVTNTRVYVSHENTDDVTLIDAATHHVIGSVQAGSRPGQMAVSPDNKRLYVNNRAFEGTVSVVDTSTNNVLGDPIVVGAAPSGVAVSPDGTRVYVSNRVSSTVSVIDAESVASGP